MILKAIFHGREGEGEGREGEGKGFDRDFSVRGKNMLIDHILNYSNKKIFLRLGGVEVARPLRQ